MLSGGDWASNPGKRKDLTKLICSYFETYEGRNLFEIHLIISSGKNTWKITKEKI